MYASIVMTKSYPSDGIFNQHLIIIKDSYILYLVLIIVNVLVIKKHIKGFDCNLPPHD